MKLIWRFGTATLALALVTGIGSMAGLAQDKEGVIKDRQALMKQQGGDLKAIGDYLNGKGDQATAQAKADDLVATSQKIPTLFVAGTSSADFPGKTHAKPEIWQQWDKFKDTSATLHEGAEKLAAAVKAGDKAAVKAQMGELGKNACGSCHTNFREKMS